MEEVDARDKPGHDELSLLESDLAEIDAVAELRRDGFPASSGRLDLDRVGARVPVELVELEVAVVVARRLGHGAAVLHQPHLRALDAVDHAALLGRHRAADEAFCVAPEVAVPDARAR